MKLADAIEWAHRAEPAEVFIASHPRKTQNALWALVEEVERLTALCDGYRGERDALKAELADAKSISAATIGHQGSLLEAATGRAESAESALTRARAEGMEAAAVIAETVYAREDIVIRGTGYDIAAHIRAAKGEQ